MTDEEIAIRQWLSKPAPYGHACCCLGRQDDDPVCPCRMAYVEKVNGVYYDITEHRSPDGITHTAERLKYQNKKEADEAELIALGYKVRDTSHMTLKERLQEKWGKRI